MKGVRILYIEDELFLGKIVSESLQSRGFDVVMEADGAQVLSVFVRIQPDIIVLDIMLPNKDGFAVAAEIRQMDKAVPIIFLTAKTQTQDLVKGFHTGANDYIRKPFSMEELIVRIENALRSRDQSRREEIPAEIPLGRYTFHTLKQVLRYDNGSERKLTFRESELLKLLCSYQGEILDRRSILQLLWGDDSFFNSRSLDVYITRLRSYLKEDEQLQIITMKGIGYRFVTT